MWFLFDVNLLGKERQEREKAGSGGGSFPS